MSKEPCKHEFIKDGTYARCKFCPVVIDALREPGYAHLIDEPNTVPEQSVEDLAQAWVDSMSHWMPENIDMELTYQQQAFIAGYTAAKAATPVTRYYMREGLMPNNQWKEIDEDFYNMIRPDYRKVEVTPAQSSPVTEAAKEILKLLIDNSATPFTPTEYGFHYDDLQRLSKTIAGSAWQAGEQEGLSEQQWEELAEFWLKAKDAATVYKHLKKNYILTEKQKV